MFIKIQPINLIQIFRDFMMNYKVIFKGIEGPDDTWVNQSNPHLSLQLTDETVNTSTILFFIYTFIK